MNEIDQMLDHIQSIRELLQGFDLTVHNDEGNEDHVKLALGGLDQLEGAVGDLVP
jgi:hypothetical protein